MAIAATLVIGGVSFYGGMKYAGAQNTSPGPGNFANLSASQRQARFQQTGAVGQAMMGQRGMGGLTIGEVISKDENSITLKLQDGGSKIILANELTPVSKSISGSIEDLKIGEQVSITGVANQDGSITANSIRIGDQILSR